MRNEKVIMKNEKCRVSSDEWLERYLAGQAPLHGDRLRLPSDTELDAAEVEFDGVVAAAKRPARHIPLWPWAAVAVMLVVVFLLWPRPEAPSLAPPNGGRTSVTPEESTEQPLLAQQIKEEHPIVSKKIGRSHTQKEVEEPLKEKMDVYEPLGEKIAGLTIVPTSADLGPGVTMRLGGDCSMLEGEETLAKEKEQQPSLIPPDKQALAEIYLAEVALQVAYERQAQAEALRAYAASLTGEEEPQSIIIF